MSKKRRYDRYTRRLEAEFRVGERVLRGISSNVSARGLFVRTSTPLTAGSPVDITIFLHDGRRSEISGIVRRAIRTNFTMIKNGMGIELTACDSNFMDILRELGSDVSATQCNFGVGFTGNSKDIGSGPASPHPPASPGHDEGSPEPHPEFLIVSCAECGAKNRVRTGMPDRMTPRCGKCKAPLPIP